MSTTTLRAEIESKTRNFLVEEFEVDGATIKSEAPLKETLGLDSLDYVDLVVVIQENFGLKLTAEDFQKIVTFQDFYDHVEQRIGSKT